MNALLQGRRVYGIGAILLLVSAILLVSFWGSKSFSQKVKAQEGGEAIFLPLSMRDSRPYWPFSIESNDPIVQGSELLTRTQELGVRQTRLNRISWRILQPNEAGAIDWSLMVSFEDELRALKASGIALHVVVDDYPAWATDNTVRTDGQTTSCGPLRDDKVAAFATFVAAVVERYKTDEFNVHIWELGNEPDIDPNLVRPDSVFGCWGEIADPYYGGERYGRMIIEVSQAIKQEDPSARVWIGGLLLDKPDSRINPNCGLPACGRSELFLEGILKAGAGPYIDGVPYHYYPPYLNQVRDHDNNTGGAWDAWGGGSLGKARFIRQTMEKYNFDVPLYLNETALMCPSYYTWCASPAADFYEAQANFLVRTFSRVLSEDIQMVSWYTINGPAWRFTGLLDENNDPLPTYYAYQELINQLDGKRYRRMVDYGAGIEAYSFVGTGQSVHVVWTMTNQYWQITIPASDFIAAYTRQGTAITPTITPGGYQLPIGFSPIYVQVRQP